MAVLSQITCEACGAKKDVWHSPSDPRPRVCATCEDKRLTAAREEHFAKLDALTLEERLRRVEGWIYDYRPQWVPPPRF